jgi:Arc/MetJ-type ribon-helix-helix transcriptional regulator
VGLQRWIEQQIADGRFVDADDYLRHLVRRDLERAERGAASAQNANAKGC